MSPIPELDDLLSTVADRCSAGTELDRLHTAVAVAQEVSGLGEDLVTHFVDQARAEGASWADIGAALGVSRQGAHQRLRDRPKPERWWRADTGRWTDRARRALRIAVEEAKASGHEFIGTEHLLLGIIGVPDNVGLAALVACGADPAALRTDVLRRMPHADHFVRLRMRQPFTPLARRAVDLASGEARALGHNFLGCEHLTIALAQGEGAAAEALAAAGIDADQLRDKAVELLHGLLTRGRRGKPTSE